MKKAFPSSDSKRMFKFDPNIKGDEHRAAKEKKEYDERIVNRRDAIRQVAKDLHANDADKVVTLASNDTSPEAAVTQVRRENPLLFDVSTLKRGDIDISKLTAEDYMVLREQNPSAVGLQ